MTTTEYPRSPGEATQQTTQQKTPTGEQDTHSVKAKEPEKKDTAYVVLQKNQAGWVVLGQTQASSAKAAVSNVIGKDPKAGTYVGVPERSWQPITVKVETQTVVRFD